MTDHFAAKSGTANSGNGVSDVAPSQAGHNVSSNGNFERKPANNTGQHGQIDGHPSGAKNEPMAGGQGAQTRPGAAIGQIGRTDDSQKHASERQQTNVAHQGRTYQGSGPADRGQGKAGAQTVGSTGHTGNAESHKKHAPDTDTRPDPADHNVTTAAGAHKHGHVQTTGRGRENGDSTSEVKSRTPHMDHDNGATSHQERSNMAETAISEDAKARIAKSEGKDGKRYKKSLKEEAKAEDNALKNKMKELESLRKVHKHAAKNEAIAAAEHSKAIKNEHKLDMDFHSARSKHDSALAELKAKEDTLIASKRHTMEQSQRLEVKQKEVEEFREKKAADDREREAKLKHLTENPARASAT